MKFNMRENNDVFKETLMILSYFDDDLLKKIPSKFFKKMCELAADSKMDFYIEKNKKLYEQNISEEAKDLISLIYYNYIAEDNEKKELIKTWYQNDK